MKPRRTAADVDRRTGAAAGLLGDDWLTPELFRFGASTLANDVLMQIAKTVDGNYQSADYFSLP